MLVDGCSVGIYSGLFSREGGKGGKERERETKTERQIERNRDRETERRREGQSSMKKQLSLQHATPGQCQPSWQR